MPFRRWGFASAALTLAAVSACGPRAGPGLTGGFTITRGVFGDGGDPGDAVLLGDCDGDGRLEVMLLGVDGAAGLYRHTPAAPDGSGGGYTLVAAQADLLGPSVRLDGGVLSGALADLDGDGRLDLVVSSGAVDVLRGLDGCRFAPPRRVADGLAGRPLQVQVHDVDRDGLADLAVATEGSLDAPYRLLLARGDGSFDDATPPPTPLLAGIEQSGYRTFSTFFDDLDGDGVVDEMALVDRRLSWVGWGTQAERPTFVRDDALTRSFAVQDPMSVAALDADRDGRVDYFASEVMSTSRLYRNRAPMDLVDVAAAAGVATNDFDDWGAAAFDADLDGWTDLLVLREGYDRAAQDAKPAAFFHNLGSATASASASDGGARFEELGRSVLGGDGFGAQDLVCGDLDGDGRVVCFARDVHAGNVELASHVAPRGGWVGLRLRGTVSSPDGYGARVSLDGASPPLVVPVGGRTSLGGGHGAEVELAVGDAARAAVTIAWPSGVVQHLADLPAGAYAEAVEPAAVTVSARVVPADGASTVDVTVDPAAAGARAGELDRFGDGDWAGPATVDARGAIHRTLRAPTQPGFARILVTLDGAPLAVRPRVRFVAP